MKKITSASLALLATALMATSAHAEKRWPNWYVGLHGGWATDRDYDTNTGTDVSTDGGYILGASLGYVPPTEIPFFNQTRYELEYSYRNNEIQSPGSGDVESHSALFNLIYDFTNDTQFTPYVGGGIGLTRVDFAGDDDTTFAWQLLAGLDFEPEAVPHTVWGVRYRYLGTNDADLPGGVEADYDSHSIEATARFRF